MNTISQNIKWNLSQRIVIFLVICVFNFGYTYAQLTYELHPDLQGYESCGPMDNPIKCLENTIASIDADEGFYSSFDEIKKGVYKAEYYMQLAYIYMQFDNKDMEFKNLQKAQESLFSIHNNDNLGSTRADKLRDMIFEQLRKHCDDPLPQNKHLCDSLIRLLEPEVENQVASKETSNSDSFSGKEKSEPIYKESGVNTYLLELLRSYMAKHPLSWEFTSMHASDSCVLEISRRVDPNIRILDCYLAHSYYTDELGEGMMGISKEINYSMISNGGKIDMTILFRPDDSNEITLKNGIFYVYYKTQN